MEVKLFLENVREMALDSLANSMEGAVGGGGIMTVESSDGGGNRTPPSLYVTIITGEGSGVSLCAQDVCVCVLVLLDSSLFSIP